MIRLQFYLESGRAASLSLVFCRPHYSAPASKRLETRRNKSDICWRRSIIRQCPPTQSAFQNAALIHSEFNSITVMSLLSSSRYNPVGVHHCFGWTREHRASSVSLRCSPLPRGWGRTWPSSGCPLPSPPPQSSAPPPGAAGQCLPASPTGPTEHAVDGKNIVKLRAKSRAFHSERAFNWIYTVYGKVTDYNETKQTCFNEQHFTSPA